MSEKFLVTTVGTALLILVSTSTSPAANAMSAQSNIAVRLNTIASFKATNLFLAQTTGQGGQEGNSGSSGQGGSGGSSGNTGGSGGQSGGNQGGQEGNSGTSGGSSSSSGGSKKVPEPTTTLLASALAFSAGGILKRKLSKKYKND